MAADPIVWVLADDRTGNVSQATGVAAALGVPCETMPLAYNALARLPNLALGATFRHLRSGSAARLVAPWPDIVIAAGRRTAPVARAIKRSSGGTSFLVQIMWPGRPVAGFDLVAVPAHDRIRAGGNIVTTVGAPHRVTDGTLATAREAWKARLGGLSTPRIAVLVGGSTRRRRFSPAMARELCRLATALGERTGGTLMVATSRRTGPELTELLRAEMRGHIEFHAWQPDRNGNPYLGYLAWSDAVIVTGDSSSMCTEACAAGCPVYIFAPPGLAGSKHGRLHRALYDRGSARPLAGTAGDAGLEEWRGEPLDDAAVVAAEIRRRLADRGAA